MNHPHRIIIFPASLSPFSLLGPLDDWTGYSARLLDYKLKAAIWYLFLARTSHRFWYVLLTAVSKNGRES
jgi:hypothetical protein